jgi:hypothetical protein
MYDHPVEKYLPEFKDIRVAEKGKEPQEPQEAQEAQGME